MGKRSALAIGVSNYGEGFEALPGSLLDVQEMAKALQDQDCGAYDVEVYENKDRTFLEEAIGQFFRKGEPDDLLLFYFSGHGDLGTGGFLHQRLHLCATNSEKDSQGLIEYSAISAQTLIERMATSRSKNIIVILDCCYSGKVADFLKKGEEALSLDVFQAEGRVVLASCNAHQVALQEKQGLSLYTKYLLEGIQGGVDTLRDWISVQELHQYADERFSIARHGGSQPQIIVVDKTSYNLPIFKAPKRDPKIECRAKIKAVYQDLENRKHSNFDGVIPNPSIARGRFETCPACLNLTQEELTALEKEVQAPYLIRAQKRKEYVKYVKLALADNCLGAEELKWLLEIGENLGLGDEDAVRIEQELGFSRVLPETSAHTPNLEKEKSSPASVPKIEQRYAKLNEYLEKQEWKEADQETYRLMITKVGREEGDDFRESDLAAYPCDDLLKIDRLWLLHSHGKFGFSVQTKIWKEFGKPRKYDSQWDQFGEFLGWCKDGNWLSYSSLNPSLSSPEGNFPARPLGIELVCVGLWVLLGGASFSTLSQRLENCSR